MEVQPADREKFMTQLLNLKSNVPSTLDVNSPNDSSMLNHTRNLTQSQEPLRNHPKLKNINQKELQRYDELKEQLSISGSQASKYPYIVKEGDPSSSVIKFPKFENHKTRQRNLKSRNSQNSSHSGNRSVYSYGRVETR